MVTFPPGWVRTKNREPSRFQTNFGAALRQVQREIAKMNGTNLRIDVDVPMRKDGLPYASFVQPEDRGVVVYWSKNGTQYAIACDLYTDVAGNMRAIGQTLQAKRDIQRWGATTEKAEYEGYKALPPGSGNPADYAKAEYVQPPHEVLGIHERASPKEVKEAYRRLILEAHPDKGGTSERMQKITEAYQAMSAGAAQ